VERTEGADGWLLNAQARARERWTEGCCRTEKEREREREKERVTRGAARRFSAKLAFSAVRESAFSTETYSA